MERIENDRSFLKYLLLGYLTCYIYCFWFISRLAKDVNILCEKDGKKTPGLLVYILLGVVTLGIYPIFWWSSVADRLHLASREYEDLRYSTRAADILLWLVAGWFCLGICSWYAMYKVIDGVNAVATAYNKKNGCFS